MRIVTNALAVVTASVGKQCHQHFVNRCRPSCRVLCFDNYKGNAYKISHFSRTQP